MKSPLSVDQWQLFLQIAERGSLTETAAARDVAQSAISRQLGAIERACGGKLFERTPRGVRLNEVGQRLYPRVQAWVQQGRMLTADATGELREPAGLVRLGIIESLADEVCTPVLADTRDLASVHPDTVQALADAWQAWANRVGVVPWDQVLAGYRAWGKSEEEAAG